MIGLGIPFAFIADFAPCFWIGLGLPFDPISFPAFSSGLVLVPLSAVVSVNAQSIRDVSASLRGVGESIASFRCSVSYTHLTLPTKA